MQYSPKLKNAMEEIKLIIDKYDIAACVVLHTPGFSEFLNKIDPSYSCAKIKLLPDGTEGVHFKANAKELSGGAAERDQKSPTRQIYSLSS